MTLLGQRSFDDLGAPLSEVPFCVLDLETTGVSPDLCEITEIGAIRYEGGIETGRYQTLVNPGTAIPPTVTVMTGITHAMVVDAPKIGEALPAFLEFIGDAVIVGHNVRFDISFLNAAALRLGYPKLPNRSADTLRLARRLIRSEVRSLKLSSLAAHLGSPTTPTHRAFEDALATAHVFWALLERAGAIGVTHLDDLLALPTIKGSRAIGKLALTERLPRTAGVYVFRDRLGTPLYIGKATNLRSRVRSYFAGDTRKRTDSLLRDMSAIDHIPTTSEIEAAVLEVRMIAAESPDYNRRSKPPRSLHWVRLTAERYPRLSLVRSVDRGLTHLGPFRNRKTAEAAMHAIWDASTIRRCSSKGRGCDYAQLGIAVCPCDGSVSEASYRAIVDELLEGLSSRPERLIAATSARLQALVANQRFEEAASCRDGWETLARALRRQRLWSSLQRAGTIVAARDGVNLMVRHGAMAATWKEGAPPPLFTEVDQPQKEYADSMLAMDEASLLWDWLMDDDTTIVSVSDRLASPSRPVPQLTPQLNPAAQGHPS
ncbi:MAG: DEDD exonuclease domain-containing protein [Acidimicrobiia bacterium]